MAEIDLSFIGALVRLGQNEMVRQCLADPWVLRQADFFADAGQPFAEGLAPVRRQFHEDPGLEALLTLHVAARALMGASGENDPARRRLPAILPVDEWLAPLTWNQALAGTWRAAPVLLTADQAYCRYFMVGQVAGAALPAIWPDWADAVMDVRCRDALQTAAVLAKKLRPDMPGCFVFPLTVPTASVQFTGASLGLSVALGLLMADRGMRQRPIIAACGCLDADGRVREVEQAAEKIGCAENSGFHALVLPIGNHDRRLASALELLPVENLEEAWTLVRLYEPGRGRDLLRLADMLADPDAFVRQADLVEAGLIGWCRRHGKLTHLLACVFDNPQRVNLLIDKLDGCLKRRDLTAARVIADLTPVEQVKAIGTKWPVAALRLCTLSLALANHCGNVTAADRWIAAAEDLVAEALTTDLDTCAAYFNNRFVSLHNRYVFDPDLTVNPALLVTVLERRYKVLARAGCRVDRPLGELCGTLAQHCGFCGPMYLDACLDWISKGKKAFGGGRVAEMQPELNRLNGYLVYVLLDAGLTDKAQSALRAYIDRRCRRWTADTTARLSCWQHAALARLLAEVAQPADCRDYLNGAETIAAVFGSAVHPQQLWQWNLGRMALKMGENKIARRFFHQSLNLCVGKEAGPTITAMALLPLAGLTVCGKTDRHELSAGWHRAMEAADSLNPRHFEALLQQPMTTALVGLWAAPEKYFPFSYR
jgi:hypothetical protein